MTKSTRSIFILLFFFYHLSAQQIGGSGDGYATDRFLGSLNGTSLETLFKGGKEEGSAQAFSRISIQGIDFLGIHQGGSGDGHGTAYFTGLLNGVTTSAMFRGGENDGFDQLQGSGQIDNVALPIELLTFQAIPIDANVLLKWTTITEKDNAFFKIERSQDGLEFRAITEVPGAGTTVDQQGYEFLDTAPLPGWSYYRLTSVDFDGTVHFSEIEAIYFETISKWELTILSNPNRGGDALQFLLNVPSSVQTLDLELLDMLGRSILKRKIESGNEDSLHSIQLPMQLIKGTYYLKASSATGQIGRMFFIQ